MLLSGVPLLGDVQWANDNSDLVKVGALSFVFFSAGQERDTLSFRLWEIGARNSVTYCAEALSNGSLSLSLSLSLFLFRC
eukprot:SAG11_NODE_213_length_12262_cov_8.391597_10_plen_80_part_00